MSDLFTNEKPAKITAEMIVKLLREKHSEDVFVTECKDGPTQSASHFRMDAWAMNRSWANPCVSAYEVKVSRADFLGDNKWRSYLPCCNQLSFVCPRGLIRIDELPAEVGLYYVASTGGRLTTQRKPVWRDVVIPDSVWRYILMCRATIKGEGASMSKADYWREWLAEKKEDRRLGYECAKAIREHVSDVESENRKLTSKMKDYDGIREVLNKLGWTEPDKEWISAAMVERKVASLKEVVPPWFIRQLADLERECARLRTNIAAEP